MCNDCQFELFVLCDREFGSSKRMSEAEKKDLSALVSRKIQCTKEAWGGELKRLEGQLADEKQQNSELGDLADALVEQVAAYLRGVSGRVKHDIQTDPEEGYTTRRCVSEDEDVADLRSSKMRELGRLLSRLQDFTNRVLLEKDDVDSQRTRCLGLLGISSKNCKLDKELGMYIKDTETHIKERDKDIEGKASKINKLESDIVGCNLKWKLEVEQRETALRTVRSHMDGCHEKVQSLNATVENLRQELANTRNELARYRSKADLLAKNRRLGYLYEKPRDSAKSAREEEEEEAAEETPIERQARESRPPKPGARKVVPTKVVPTNRETRQF